MQVAQNIMRRYPPPFNFLQQRAMRAVAAAYVCSESTRDVLRAKGFDKPVTIIPFGVNTEVFRPRPAAKQDRVLTIGFVGRMLPGKGLSVLAEALGKIANCEWKLLLVGDGPERSKFEAALAKAGLSERAEFTGAVSYDQIPELYQRMDIAVMTTRTTSRIREQFGRVLVEAMACGIPVIGTTCGAIPEVLDNAGLLLPEGDAGALAQAMRRMLSDRDLRERCARLGRIRIEEHYSWELVARKTYQLFQLVLKGSAPADVLHQVEAAA